MAPRLVRRFAAPLGLPAVLLATAMLACGGAGTPLVDVPDVAPSDVATDEGAHGDPGDDRPAPADAPANDAAPDAGPADAPPGDAAPDAADTPGDADPADAAPADVPQDPGVDVPHAGPCPDGTPRRSFRDVPDVAALRAPAADLVVPTTAGPWDLRANWTGCESLLFVPDQPRQNAGWPDTLFRDGINAFLFALPASARVFFVSVKADPADRVAALDGLAQAVERFLAGLPPAEAAAIRARLHYVDGAPSDLPGWLGTLLRSPGWGVAVDRLQRIRFLGSLADWSRYDPDRQWFAPVLRMAANEPAAFDFEAAREADLEARPATVVPGFAGGVLSDPGWSGARGFVDVALPDAATMAGFDTLELDLALHCDGDGEYGVCPAWDYLVHLYLCDADDPDRCDVELGRWITPYHREGRWVHDVSPLLPLLAGGGPRRLAFYTQQPYRVTLDLRLSDGGRSTRPFAARFLFGGGAFGPAYNDAREPVAVPVPADAARVVLAVAATGHGGVQPGNCAEFCTTTHHFTVNGVEHVVRFDQPGDPEGCMRQVAEGTVPNQYGTWWYGRNGWCPGREVALLRVDVTADAPAGADAVVAYRGLYQGQAYPAEGAAIVLSSWLVFERARGAVAPARR